MSFKHQTQSWAALMAQTVKDLPVMQETRVQNLGQEDPRKKGMTTHSSVLARGIPWTEELGGLQSLGSQRARHDSVTVNFQQCCSGSRIQSPGLPPPSPVPKANLDTGSWLFRKAPSCTQTQELQAATIKSEMAHKMNPHSNYIYAKHLSDLINFGLSKEDGSLCCHLPGFQANWYIFH